MIQKRNVITAILVVILAVAVLPVAANALIGSTDDKATIRALDKHTFDPVAYALGVRTEDQAVEYGQARQRRNDEVAAAVAKGSEPAAITEYKEIAESLDDAIDELYLAVSSTPEAAALQAKWRRCMAERGFSFDSPMAIEQELDEGVSDPSSGVLAARDECLRVDETQMELLVLEAVPEWKTKHAHILEAMRLSIDLPRFDE